VDPLPHRAVFALTTQVFALATAWIRSRTVKERHTPDIENTATTERDYTRVGTIARPQQSFQVDFFGNTKDRESSR